MSELRDDITSEFEAIQSDWPNVRNETKAKISTMKSYYGTVDNKHDVVDRTDSDRRDLEHDLERHKDLASGAANIQRDLTTQVESSENRVQRMYKHGRPAAIAFPLLCAIIGGIIGAKVPGWGQVVAIVLGAVLAFILSGVLALVCYFFLKWRFIKRCDMWKKVQENQEGMVSASYIKAKKSDLNEIRELLNDIEEDNLVSGRAALLDKMTDYLDDHDH